MKFYYLFASMFVALLALGLVGCEEGYDDNELEDSTEEATQAELITAIPVGPDQLVEFYDDSPYGVVISETGLANKRPVLPDYDLANLGPIELHQLLRPDLEVPTALLDVVYVADEFARNIDKFNPQSLPSELELPPVDPSHMIPVNDSFADLQLNKVSLATDYETPSQTSYCSANWFKNVNKGDDYIYTNRTGSGDYWRYDKHFGFFSTCPYRGTITMQLKTRRWWTWSSLKKYTVKEDYYRYIWVSDTKYDFDIHFMSRDAYGDGYHLSWDSATWPKLPHM